MAIGMAAAGSTGNWSPAAQYLNLANQTAEGEDEQARKRRLAALQASQLKIGGGLASGYSAALSPAGTALGFGG